MKMGKFIKSIYYTIFQNRIVENFDVNRFESTRWKHSLYEIIMVQLLGKLYEIFILYGCSTANK